MLEKWLASIVISFVLRQVAKFKKDTDWAKVKADLETRVKDLVPGTWFDAEASALVDLLMDKLVAILSATNILEGILEKVAAEDWTGAVEMLKELLLSALSVQAKASVAVAAM